MALYLLKLTIREVAFLETGLDRLSGNNEELEEIKESLLAKLEAAPRILEDER